MGGDGSTQLVLEVAKARAALARRKHSALEPGQRGSMGGRSQDNGWIAHTHIHTETHTQTHTLTFTRKK